MDYFKLVHLKFNKKQTANVNNSKYMKKKKNVETPNFCVQFLSFSGQISFRFWFPATCPQSGYKLYNIYRLQTNTVFSFQANIYSGHIFYGTSNLLAFCQVRNYVNKLLLIQNVYNCIIALRQEIIICIIGSKVKIRNRKPKTEYCLFNLSLLTGEVNCLVGCNITGHIPTSSLTPRADNFVMPYQQKS